MQMLRQQCVIGMIFFFYINNTMKSEKSHTVGTVPKYNRKNTKKYHTVGTVPKSNREIKDTTLLEQFQNLTEK